MNVEIHELKQAPASFELPRTMAPQREDLLEVFAKGWGLTDDLDFYRKPSLVRLLDLS